MNGSAKPNEAAAYIEQTAAELSELAKRSEMNFLVYLLEMVRLEAASRVLSAADGGATGNAAPR